MGDSNPRMTAMIIIFGIGYAIALTLLILGCTEEKKFFNLMLLIPFVFSPTMTIFLPSGAQDGSFWTQFVCFLVAFFFVCSFAMPLVFWDVGSIGLTGLGYGLGASFTLYGCLFGAAYYWFSTDDNYGL